MSAGELEGAATPPRSNGELVFDSPWQARAFGLAHVLCDAGHFGWDDFQRALIARIGAWERQATPDDVYSYYEQWLGALEDLLAEFGLCDAASLVEREAVLAARPHGHDHQ